MCRPALDIKEQQEADRHLAIAAESLFLINLMLLPGVGFAMLVALHFGSRGGNCPLSRNHLSQTLGVSIIGGALIVVVLALFFLFGGFGPYTWLWAVFYFTCVHTSLIFMGVFGFIKALNGQHFTFPVLGRYFQQ